MRRRISASVVVFGLMLLSGFLVSSSQAQINGVPASVTSPGFGGRAINGTPASVTSLGPNGFTPNAGFRFFNPFPHPFPDGFHRHHRLHNVFPVFGGVYPVPVAVPYPVESADNGDSAEDESDYQGGPTVFDRRGRGEQSYIPPVKDAAPAHAYQAAPDPLAETPQEPTVLVFKDGHQLEVGNYAIVGRTLYDLTPGHPRRIALADLDLEATQKRNDDRGVTFQLPPA
jgi:hypothetical protein